MALGQANSGAVDNAGHAESALQDQHTPLIMLPMVQKLVDAFLAVDAVVDAYTATVDDATGMVAGQHFRIINAAADKFYFGTILSIAAEVITLDTMIDFVYVSGSGVTTSNINMVVDGSGTPVVFTARTGAPSIPSDVDITRIIFQCITDSAVDLNKFGNLAKLTRGLALRFVDGDKDNIFNVKTNADLAGLAFDFTPYVASNPGQGVHGFIARLTFAGQNKIGVTIRIGPEDNLEMVVQDDLTFGSPDIISLVCTIEGHVVQP